MSAHKAAIQAAWPIERILEHLEQLASAETTRSHDVTCKGCRNTYSYKLPAHDGATQLKALQQIHEHGYGKAAPTKELAQEPVDPDVDPASLSSTERQRRIAQLRARLAGNTEQPKKGSEPDLSAAS